MSSILSPDNGGKKWRSSWAESVKMSGEGQRFQVTFDELKTYFRRLLAKEFGVDMEVFVAADGHAGGSLSHAHTGWELRLFEVPDREQGERTKFQLVPPYTPHNGGELPGNCLVIFVDVDELRLSWGGRGMSIPTNHCRSASLVLDNLLNAIAATGRGMSPELLIALRNALLLAIVEVAGQVSVQIRTHPQNRDICGAGIEFIEKRFADPELNVGGVARAIQVSPRWLNREFQRRLGRSVSVHIRETRLRNAARLLVMTGLPLERIANESGYREYFYFSNVFFRRFGVRPSVCRCSGKLPPGIVMDNSDGGR